MSATFIQYISLIVIILFLVMLAQKMKVAYPIILVIGGLALSLSHIFPTIQINPELILFIFLPPLLYEAAWDTSWKEFWKWRRVISSFAFLIVLLTSVAIAFVSSWIIPGFTIALGFLLGGIVSPPDAVSATSILKVVKVPKRISAIIEGESLLNDASSLIVFRFALIAVDTGRFIFQEAAFSFVLMIVMGVLTGIVIGMLYYIIHRWLPTTSHMDIVLTLTAPYVMYMLAEYFHFSGVLAVVSGGLFLSSKRHLFLQQSSRLQGTNVWNTISFVLNGLIFMLIGLELPVIINQLGDISLKTAIAYGAMITFALIIIRIMSTIGASWFTQFISHYITTADSRPGWKGPLIFAWAGMRGVVSLAAALSIPFYLGNGTPFPQRSLILFITFVVIILTLIVQGLTLPLMIKWLGVEESDDYIPTEQMNLIIKEKIASQSIQILDNEYEDVVKNNRLLQHLRAKYEIDKSPEDDSSKEEMNSFKKVYLELLEKQRSMLSELNKKSETDEEVIKNYQNILDLEEEKIINQGVNYKT